MFCSHCGAKNHEGSPFCNSCGRAFSPQPPVDAGAPSIVPRMFSQGRVADGKRPSSPPAGGANHLVGFVVFGVSLALVAIFIFSGHRSGKPQQASPTGSVKSPRESPGTAGVAKDPSSTRDTQIQPFWTENKSSAGHNAGTFIPSVDLLLRRNLQTLSTHDFHCGGGDYAVTCTMGAESIMLHHKLGRDDGELSILAAPQDDNSQAVFMGLLGLASAAVGHIEWRDQLREGIAQLQSKFPPPGERFMEAIGLYHSTKDYDLSLSLMDNSSYKLFGEMIASSGGKDESTAGAMANIELPDIEYWVFTITPARQVPLQ